MVGWDRQCSQTTVEALLPEEQIFSGPFALAAGPLPVGEVFVAESRSRNSSFLLEAMRTIQEAHVLQ